MLFGMQICRFTAFFVVLIFVVAHPPPVNAEAAEAQLNVPAGPEALATLADSGPEDAPIWVQTFDPASGNGPQNSLDADGSDEAEVWDEMFWDDLFWDDDDYDDDGEIYAEEGDPEVGVQEDGNTGDLELPIPEVPDEDTVMLIRETAEQMPLEAGGIEQKEFGLEDSEGMPGFGGGPGSLGNDAQEPSGDVGNIDLARRVDVEWEDDDDVLPQQADGDSAADPPTDKIPEDGAAPTRPPSDDGAAPVQPPLGDAVVDGPAVANDEAPAQPPSGGSMASEEPAAPEEPAAAEEQPAAAKEPTVAEAPEAADTASSTDPPSAGAVTEEPATTHNGLPIEGPARPKEDDVWMTEDVQDQGRKPKRQRRAFVSLEALTPELPADVTEQAEKLWATLRGLIPHPALEEIIKAALNANAWFGLLVNLNFALLFVVALGYHCCVRRRPKPLPPTEDAPDLEKSFDNIEGEPPLIASTDKQFSRGRDPEAPCVPSREAM